MEQGKIGKGSDSDWAGDKETRKASFAGVAVVGRHLSKSYRRKQKIITRNSAETELHAAAAKVVQSKMCDLGFAIKLVLIIDAKATEHILHRHGIGKMKRIDEAHLWLQDEVKIEQVKSPPCHARAQSCGHWEESTEHQNACDIHGVR